MRITKKMLREAKGGMRKRITELCAILKTGGMKDEMRRCFPAYSSTPSNEMPSDEECLRSILTDLLDLAIPIHWHE